MMRVLECDDSDVCLNQMQRKIPGPGIARYCTDTAGTRMDQYREDARYMISARAESRIVIFPDNADSWQRWKIREHVERIC